MGAGERVEWELQSWRTGQVLTGSRRAITPDAMLQHASWMPRTPFGVIITAIAALMFAAMLYLIVAPAFVDFNDYRRVEASGRVATSTARGVLRLRLYDDRGNMQRISCDARGRSGACLLPAVRAGLIEGELATVTYLAPPEGVLFTEPVVLQIEQSGRALLDCGKRLRALGMESSTC